jgi:hypothetical protein
MGIKQNFKKILRQLAGIQPLDNANGYEKKVVLLTRGS